MANQAYMLFASAATTVISLTATVTSTYVVGGQTELDNSTDLYPMATATLEVTDTFGAAPTGPIRLYMQRGDVDGTTDDANSVLGYAAKVNADAVTALGDAEYLGAFRPSTDAAYRKTININIAGVKKARFYLQNASGTTMVYSTNAITLKIHPFTLAPAA